MKRNPKENPDSTIDRLYFLIIVFLIGALVFFLFMIVLAGKKLNSHWDKGPGIDLGSDTRYRLAANHPDQIGKGEDLLMEVDLDLNKNAIKTIEFKPIYRTKRGDSGRSFLKGVTGGRIYFAGETAS